MPFGTVPVSRRQPAGGAKPCGTWEAPAP
ncbi:MAG: hypothetical protein QOH30_2630, partial [Baekduia sp.]|nr:hypothetical protein [Baekduia sp.]